MTVATSGSRAWSPGSVVGPYEIVSFLAAGGMGEIYVARDPRLGRDVALKVLPRIYGTDHERLRRFEQEARAAGQLNHPNLLTVYDLGRSGELPYIVTELLEGRTLRQVLQEKTLTISETLNYAMQIGRGMAAAHDKGVVHRDLKPSNIFVTSGDHVKIVDFGLAKLTHPEWDQGSREDDTISLVSTPGMVVGSAGYMSPEQVQGTHVDHRSDIFSFGAILYEMLRGRRAFSGDSAVETMHAVLKDQPSRLTKEIPPQLVAVVERCLEKRPENRYASARDLVFQLQQISSDVNSWPSAPREQRAVAVLRRPLGAIVVVLLLTTLGFAAVWWSRSQFRGAGDRSPLSFRARDWVLISDFENHTGEAIFDNAAEYALKREIAESRYVNVVPRTRINDVLSLMKRSSTARIDAALGREICIRDGGIRALLAGRIAKSGPHYMLNVALVDPRSGATVAACAEQAADREKVADATRRCSSRVRAALGEAPALIRQTQEKLANVTTESFKALELYSKAKALRDQGKYDTAEGLLREAVALDPQFASAYILLALAIQDEGDPNRPKEDWLRPAEKAFELSSGASDRERFFIRGSYYQLTGEYEKARVAYEDLLTLYPDDYDAVDNLCALFSQLGQWENAGDMLARRADLKPQNFFENYSAAKGLLVLGREREWEKYRARAERLTPDKDFPPDIIRQHPEWVAKLKMLPAFALWLRGEASQALQTAAARATREVPQDEATITELANFYLLLGRLRDAESWTERSSDLTRREANLEMIAFERGDGEALGRYVLNGKNHPGFLAMLLVNGPPLSKELRLRVLAEAERGINDFHQRGPTSAAYLDIARGSLALAHGRREEAIALLRRGVKAYPDAPLGYSLMARLALARALEDEANFSDAAKVLEPSIQAKRRAVLQFGIDLFVDGNGRPLIRYESGHLWLRAQVELARVYRRLGRVDDAGRIESELRKLLASADADYVPLRELNGMENTMTNIAAAGSR